MKRVAIPARVFPVATLFGVAFVIGACSGVSDPGAIGNPGMSPADAAIDQTSTVGDDASTLAETSAPVDARSAVDASGDVAVAEAGGGVVDAAPEGGATFPCGATDRCTVDADTCCVQPAAGGPVTQMCVPLPMNPNMAPCPAGSSAALHCVSTADCANGVCCLNGAATPVSTCRTSAQCLAGQQQLCNTADANSTCPVDAPTCRVAGGGGGNGGGGGATRLPAGVGVCQ
jgi:hypothetical protein